MRERDVLAVELVERLGERREPGVVEVGHPDRVEHDQSAEAPLARVSATSSWAWKWTAFAYQSGVANSTTSTPGTWAGCSGC